ncbi:hypothetical protein ACFL44_03165 [Gemmatimonadota bacterium]
MGMKPFLPIVPVMILFLAGCHLAIERDITIESGQSVRSSINVIDGDITIGSGCFIKSSCRTVDGDIEVGRESTVTNLQSVDGTIYVGRDVVVRRDVELVDGDIICRQGVTVGGNINAIDGRIEISNTVVEHDITTYAADMFLDDRSRVEGDIIIRRSTDDHNRQRQVRIEITGGSVVMGDILNKDENVDVRVYLSDGGRIEGRARDVEVIRR